MRTPPLPSLNGTATSTAVARDAVITTGRNENVGPASSRSLARPSLARHDAPRSLTRPSEVYSSTASTEDETTDSDTSGAESASAGEGRDTGRSGETTGAMATQLPEGAELEHLKQAVDAKMALAQQRVSLAAQKAPARTSSFGARRISPIKEEVPSVASTLDAAFGSPPTTGTMESVSAGSTESGKTIRGSAHPTPGQTSTRTPSYPFPYVPGTPKSWTSAFHQPFTTLSPTTGADHKQSRETTVSETSTPAATVGAFIPDFDPRKPIGDSQYPAPNLYDLVLLLNAEPSLEAWWTTLAKIVRDWYGAERSTLVVPADATDLENVPWGQKATFSVPDIGPRTSEQTKPATPAETTPVSRSNVTGNVSDGRPQLSTRVSHSIRPKLEARHSFAGHEHGFKSLSAEVAKTREGSSRPPGPARTKSYAPGAQLRATKASVLARSPGIGSSPLFKQRTSFSDPDFSSIGGDVPIESHNAVFPVLRPLDHERDALVDDVGVNRILERGRIVTLTREYSGSPSGSKRGSKSSKNASRSLDLGSEPLHATQYSKEQGPMRGSSHSSLTAGYEEYEQFPPSPWAQSPSPSPAIQADPSVNPFFSTTNVDEESFNPEGLSPDYTQYNQVEAIGVDRANTVIHVPLIHPILSQPMQTMETPSLSPSLELSGRFQQGSSMSSPGETQKKAPIAILSILSQTTPYPHELTRSLKLLAPHLATSFSNASQYTNVHQQATGIRQRRLFGGHHVGFAPLSNEVEPLEDLLHLDIDDIVDSADSVTSPSDCSALSRPSPGGSLVGTPGWDAFSSRHSASGSTPGHGGSSDAAESYFDARRKPSGHKPESSGHQSQSSLVSTAVDSRPGSRVRVALAAEDEKTPRGDARPKSRDPSFSNMQRRETSPLRERESTTTRKTSLRPSGTSADERADRNKHSRLHSYGADFGSSFQSVQTAPTDVRSARPARAHVRSGSMSESADLKPPSERLLRVLIETIPVQVFTASPGNGHLTWVNAKFLSYRNRSSRQVKTDPWEAVHPDDMEEYLASWRHSLRAGQQMQQKVRLRRFDGQYRWFYVRVAPLKDKKQNLVHWAGTYMDIHDQHIAELNSARQQDTAASEAKYRALANSSPQIVFAANRVRGVTFCNSQWIHFSGQTEQQALGIGFMEHVHADDIVKCKLPTFTEDGSSTMNVPTSLPPDKSSQSSTGSSPESTKTVTSPDVLTPHDMGMPQTRLSRLASTGILKVSKDADGKPSYSTEVRLRSKEGQYRWHLVRTLLAHSSGQTTPEEETWYGTCTDINDHKMLEQTLKETMDAKSRFLSNMSHEIRTPLNGITGMVNFLIDSNLTTEQLEHVNIIRSSTEGLRDLINDILDLSKVEAGMVTLANNWFNVPTLIEEVNDLTSAMAIGKGLELNYVVEEDVPVLVRGDRFRIRQVLLNVIGNAIKFTEEGEVFVRCKIQPESERHCNEDEVMLEFEVVDTGSGFSEKEKAYLFKRFSQIDASSTRQHGGTGLGLAISNQLVSLHGGKMDAMGQPGVGARFFFSVKLVTSSVDDRPPQEILTPGARTSAQPLPHLLKKATLPPGESKKATLDSPTSVKSISSPGQSVSHDSPAVSSGSSDPSIRTAQTSIRSERSSASSYLHDVMMPPGSPIRLELPPDGRPSKLDDRSPSRGSDDSSNTIVASSKQPAMPSSPLVSSLQPPMFSILVVCPLQYSRLATVRHIEMTLPKTAPHQITDRESLVECQKMIGGEDPVIFTHVVLVLHEASEVVAFVDQVFQSPAHFATSVVVVSDLMQKREVMKNASSYDYDKLQQERRLRFVFKPLKPSKIGVIFDPQKEREMSTNRSQDTATQVAVSQKQVFGEMRRRLGGKGKRVLLVEDNAINQMVLNKFLGRINMDVETVIDGVQCVEKVFEKGPSYYSVILCDLHMPNKDGYETCKAIRRWEREHGYPSMPVVALSANVLGDVYAKCVEAEFNSYVTKPVDFRELSDVLTHFLDPADPGQRHEFMRSKKAKKTK